MNKHSAQTSLTKIKKRLASGSEGESRSPRAQKSDFLWFGAGVFIMGFIALALRNFKGKSKT
jgi:hypothetical protein